MMRPYRTLSVVVLLSALFAAGCSPGADHDHEHGHDHDHEHGHEHESPKEARTVIDQQAAAAAGIVSAAVTGGTLTSVLEVTGTLRSERSAEAQVVARFSGVVDSIDVQPGERVQRGQRLAKINSNLSLSTYSLSSPISGIVSTVHKEVGASVDGDAIVTVVDPRKLRAELLLYGADVARVREAALVTVVNLGDGSTAQGRIAGIPPALDSSTQSVVVPVRFTTPVESWRAGAAVKAQISLGEQAVSVRVPRSALQSWRNQVVVFTREGDIFEARPVRTGREDREYVEIVEGLRVGQEVVVKQSFLIKADIEKSSAVHDH